MEILVSRGRLPHRFVRWVTLCVLLMVPLTASGQELEEYQVKAAFLYNFTKFVEWPTVNGSPVFAVFTLCVLGDDPFGPALDQLVKGKSVYGRPLQVRRLKDALEARQCQIVFVSRDEETRAAKLVDAVRGLPILTVGEQHRFGRIGGMIYLAMNDNRVNVVVNAAVAEKAGLKISAKLMSVAKPFKEDEGGN